MNTKICLKEQEKYLGNKSPAKNNALESGGGSVGRATASYARGPQFKSH